MAAGVGAGPRFNLAALSVTHAVDVAVTLIVWCTRLLGFIVTVWVEAKSVVVLERC